MKFYQCEMCGNVIEFLNESGVPIVCCGEEMQELVPGTSDGAAEKYVPLIRISGNKVSVLVGEVQHPSTEAHYIQWIVLETKKGVYRIMLTPGQVPIAEFLLTEDDTVIAAYEYCNLHGLWMTKA